MYLFHAQSTLSRQSSVQQPVVGVWSCENKVRKRVEVKSKILQSSRKKALKTSLIQIPLSLVCIGLANLASDSISTAKVQQILPLFNQPQPLRISSFLPGEWQMDDCPMAVKLHALNTVYKGHSITYVVHF